MKLRLTLVLLSCVLSALTGLILARSGTPAAALDRAARPLIGLSLDTLKEERWQRDRDNFVKKAAALGAEVRVQDANSDDTRQVRDVQALITMGVAVIVIAPHNGDAMAEAVQLAQRRPIIATGSYDNGQKKVPTVQLEVLPVTKDNLRETVIADGFHSAAAIYRDATAPSPRILVHEKHENARKAGNLFVPFRVFRGPLPDPRDSPSLP